MALSRTTTSAIGTSDTEVTLASTSGLNVNDTIKVDTEFMRVTQLGTTASPATKVLRGVNGSNVTAHPSGAGAVYGGPADFLGKDAISTRRRDVVSYSATGAITLPTAGRDMLAILNGTSVLAMTLADPSKENEGDVLTVVGNGKAAHTVTGSANGFGDGGGSYDAFAFAAGARNAVQFIAVNERWVVLTSLIGGTATAITATIS